MHEGLAATPGDSWSYPLFCRDAKQGQGSGQLAQGLRSSPLHSKIFTGEDKELASKRRGSNQGGRVSLRGQEDSSHSWHGLARELRGQGTSRS